MPSIKTRVFYEFCHLTPAAQETGAVLSLITDKGIDWKLLEGNLLVSEESQLGFRSI